jgi:hypothetical protein
VPADGAWSKGGGTASAPDPLPHSAAIMGCRGGEANVGGGDDRGWRCAREGPTAMVGCKVGMTDSLGSMTYGPHYGDNKDG